MYTMPEKAIKHILQKELDIHKTEALQILYNAYVPDTEKELIYIAYQTLQNVLNQCETYNQLEDYLSYAGYHMSLEDWISSL